MNSNLTENDIIFIVAIISPFLTLQLFFKVAIVISSDILLKELIFSSFITRRPDLFAAAVPICGGANFSILNNSINIPHWIFHGQLDRVVPVQKSRDAFNYLRNKKSHHKYTEFKEVYHNSWENVFDDGKFLNWLFSKSKN